MALVHPVDVKPAPRISSRFGVRTDPLDGRKKMHNGIDFAIAIGTPLVSAGTGKVLRCYVGSVQHKDYGKAIIVLHTDGTAALYAHCSAINVQEGQPVSAGAPLGLSGNTGRVTGPHLHFEIIAAEFTSKIARQGAGIGLRSSWMENGAMRTARVDPGPLIAGL